MQMESNNTVRELTINKNDMPIEHIRPVYLVSRPRQWLIKESIVMEIPSRCIWIDWSFRINTSWSWFYICRYTTGKENHSRCAWKILSSRSLYIQFVSDNGRNLFNRDPLWPQSEVDRWDVREFVVTPTLTAERSPCSPIYGCRR